MNLTAYFSDNGVPKTGLTPTMDIWKIDGTQVVTAQTMTEIAGGFYVYDFTTYDDDEDYVIRADGGATLGNTERYAVSSNETGGVGKILKVSKNRWKIDTANKTQTIYDDDGVTPLITFDLKDANNKASTVRIFERDPQ